MTEREIRLCIAGTVSEAMAQLRTVEHCTPELMLVRLVAAEEEIERARMYVNELRKLQVDA